MNYYLKHIPDISSYIKIVTGDKMKSFNNVKEIDLDELGVWLEFHKNDNVPLFIWTDNKTSKLESKFKELFDLGYPDFIIRDKLNLNIKEYNELFNKVL